MRFRELPGSADLWLEVIPLFLWIGTVVVTTYGGILGATFQVADGEFPQADPKTLMWRWVAPAVQGIIYYMLTMVQFTLRRRDLVTMSPQQSLPPFLKDKARIVYLMKTGFLAALAYGPIIAQWRAK